MFDNIISLIKPLDKKAMEKCQIRIDNLTKPLGSLHSFEHIACQMAGITGYHRPKDLQKSIIVMAADHGIVAEGISMDPQSVTAERMSDCCQGRATIHVLAEHIAANLTLVDMGIATKMPSFAQMHNMRIASATKNIAQEAAMTREQGTRAITVGREIAQGEIEKGCRILGLGAIGVGGDISSVGIIRCYSAKKVAELFGSDAKIVDELLNKKITVIERALKINQPDTEDPMDVLCKIGGFEIAGLVGVILGAAAGGAVIVLDGLATVAAALIAVKIAPQVKDYLIASHFAVDPAYSEALDIMKVPGYLHLDMHLGDGTGAIFGISLLNASLHMLNDMKTFGDAAVAIAQDGPGALKQSHDIKE